MKKKLVCCLAALAGLCAVSMVQTAPLNAHAENPIIQTAFAPDPAPVVFGDELWVFTGRDREGDNDFYYMTGWQCFSTTDMKNWTNHGCFLEDDEFSWCNPNDAWASQCIERNGKYYFYFTTTNKGGGGRAIGVGVADKPEGPYEDVLGKPLCGPNWDYIDPTVMIDDDGQAWLMFGNPECYYVKLNEDMVSLGSQIQKFNLSLQPGTKYGEGPWICKHDNLYYLVFASFVDGFGGESISYCTGPTVTGPWTHRGTIHEGSNCFTTHGGIIDYKGHSYSFYHMNGLPGGGAYNRSAACEEFTFNPDGTIPAIKSTKEGPKQLEYFDPYQRVEAETGNWFEGLKVEPSGTGSQAVGFIQNGDYIRISGVDFGDVGPTGFEASVSSDGDGGKIELHLDSATGPIIGTVTCPVTGGWQTWETVSTENISGATGVHDLYLRFSGSDGYLFNVDWWEFTSGSATPFLLGDVSEDGKITAVDMSLAKRLTDSTNKKAIKPADVDQDGKVTEEDIAWYAQFLTAQTTEYPEKKQQQTTDPDPQTTTPTTPDPQPSNYIYQSDNLQFHWAPDNYFSQPANHGQVIREDYSGINGNKKMYVYVPYGYDESKKYNVFYLMHGGGESEETCFNDNDINIDIMLDNMIANGDIEPMIVVTPTFNNCPDGAGDVWNEMRQTIIPYVEKKYSTYACGDVSTDNLKATRYHRAYGGFSMGGGSTWNMFINNLDICAYYMPLSGHCWGGAGAITSAIDHFGFQKDEYFVLAATGTDDIAYGNMVPLVNELKNDSHFVYTSDFSKGNFYFLAAQGNVHWWPQVRHYIYDALPFFFHEKQ